MADLLTQLALGSIVAGSVVLLAFAALSYRNLKGIPKEVLTARSMILFDVMARGILWFSLGFVLLILVTVLLLLGRPLGGYVIAAGSAGWAVLTYASLRTIFRSIRIPREVRERYRRPTR